MLCTLFTTVLETISCSSRKKNHLSSIILLFSAIMIELSPLSAINSRLHESGFTYRAWGLDNKPYAFILYPFYNIYGPVISSLSWNISRTASSYIGFAQIHQEAFSYLSLIIHIPAQRPEFSATWPFSFEERGILKRHLDISSIGQGLL